MTTRRAAPGPAVLDPLTLPLTGLHLIEASAAGSTPMMRIFGFVSFIAAATPLIDSHCSKPVREVDAAAARVSRPIAVAGVTSKPTRE